MPGIYIQNTVYALDPYDNIPGNTPGHSGKTGYAIYIEDKNRWLLDKKVRIMYSP